MFTIKVDLLPKYVWNGFFCVMTKFGLSYIQSIIKVISNRVVHNISTSLNHFDPHSFEI